MAHTLTITTECAAFFFCLKRWVDKQAGRAGWVSYRGSMRTTEKSDSRAAGVFKSILFNLFILQMRKLSLKK